MTAFEFYDVVRTRRSEETARLGIVGLEGVVLGIAEDEGSGTYYSVLIGDRTWGVAEVDLEATGRRVPREAIYDGAAIRVDAKGRILPTSPPG